VGHEKSNQIGSSVIHRAIRITKNVSPYAARLFFKYYLLMCLAELRGAAQIQRRGDGNEKKKKKKSRSYELSILPGIPAASSGSLVICTYGAQRERHTYKVYTGP
jgi:hypothetical protein